MSGVCLTTGSSPDVIPTCFSVGLASIKPDSCYMWLDFRKPIQMSFEINGLRHYILAKEVSTRMKFMHSMH